METQSGYDYFVNSAAPSFKSFYQEKYLKLMVNREYGSWRVHLRQYHPSTREEYTWAILDPDEIRRFLDMPPKASLSTTGWNGGFSDYELCYYIKKLKTFKLTK